MTFVEALFAVQDEDVLSGQLQHRFLQLPERARLVDARANQTVTAAENGELDLERLDMLQRQHRIEREVTGIEARLAELDGKLYGGAITTAREASTLQEEIEHLRRRQDVLESDVLEFMEAIEPLDEQLAELAELGTRQEASIAEALRDLSTAEAGVTDELDESAARREAAVSQLDVEVLDRYEKNRAAFGSSTAVRFTGTDCKGCPLAMPAVEADRVRALPSGTLVDCRECGRLVVR